MNLPAVWRAPFCLSPLLEPFPCAARQSGGPCLSGPWNTEWTASMSTLWVLSYAPSQAQREMAHQACCQKCCGWVDQRALLLLLLPWRRVYQQLVS